VGIINTPANLHVFALSQLLTKNLHTALQGPLADLEADMRRMMLPNTALNLKESRRNILKDFVQVR
jgi:hypothetical protein